MSEKKKAESATIINVSSEEVRFELDGLDYVLKPRETLATHANYALPRKMADNRDPVASVVDLLTGGKVLHIGDRRARAAVASREAIARQ